MPGYLPYEITKGIESVISDPELARKVIEIIEKGLSSIEEKAKEQKIIIKHELKDELTKELVTKDELKATEEKLRIEIKATEEKLRAEIKATEEKLRAEIKATEEKLRIEIKATEERLSKEIHRWRADTIKWMFVFWLGQLVAFIGILKFMLK